MRSLTDRSKIRGVTKGSKGDHASKQKLPVNNKVIMLTFLLSYSQF